jgi:uncharacterized membrane protein
MERSAPHATVTAPPRPAPEPPATHRYGHDTVEFARVVNLADAVFAIALTLLVLDLKVPQNLGGAALLGEQAPNMVAFALSFFLVAGMWWQHHKLFAALGWLEPGLIALNLAVLAGVALVPFPTSLVADDPSSRAAALLFVGLFSAISLLFLVLIVRTNNLRAWRHPLPTSLFRWVFADWLVSVGIHLACLAIAIWAPLAGLVGLAVGSPATAMVVARMGPPQRRAWV